MRRLAWHALLSQREPSLGKLVLAQRWNKAFCCTLLTELLFLSLGSVETEIVKEEGREPS